MKRFFLSLFLFVVLSNSLVAFAGEPATRVADGTLLPATTRTVEECKSLSAFIEQGSIDERKYYLSERADYEYVAGGFTFTANDILACGIKTGDIHLWMIPYYVRFILEFVIGIAGLVAVGGIVYGGYLYLFAGVSDEKDKGKKSIMYGVAGMIITLIAWAVVNIFVSFFTG